MTAWLVGTPVANPRPVNGCSTVVYSAAFVAGGVAGTPSSARVKIGFGVPVVVGVGAGSVVVGAEPCTVPMFVPPASGTARPTDGCSRLPA